jgi:hypothetical protein
MVNSGGYFSWKGFHDLSNIVIGANHKWRLWHHIGARGSEHELSAFKSSKLYQKLVGIALDPGGKLHNNKFGIPLFYLIGDSAYGNSRPFLIMNFDNVQPKSPQDAFNYIYSSSSISVEYAFGEIDSRWGIFWRPLQY